MDQVDIFANYSTRPTTPTRSKPPTFSSSASSSRPETPAVKSITLAEWEASAPLDEEVMGSVSLLRSACGSRAFPARFAGEAESGPSHTRPSTPSQPMKKTAQNLLQAALAGSTQSSSSATSLPSRSSSPAFGTRPSTPSSNPLTSTSTTNNGTNATVITTPQQFHDLFASLTSSLSHSQDALYRTHLEEISGYREKCEELIKELGEVEELVEGMMGCLRWVEERGESLRIAGEGLMLEESDLNLQTQHLSSRLSYFTSLEQAQRMLNNPGEELVLSEGFLGMVGRVDECLSYLRGHTDFRDAEIYIIRYQQCMTRSMTLIKMYVVNALRNLGMEVAKRVNDKQMTRSETATIALLYTKFTSLAFPLRPLLAELELRASENPTELGSLLDECHSTWISVRKGLINGRVEREVKAMEPGNAGTGLVDLTRMGCGYLKMTCLDEYNLSRQFFDTGESVVYKFLEGLCDHLYDHLRPRILHELSLTTLCEVCTVLQALMVEQIELEDEETSTPIGYQQDPESYFPPLTAMGSSGMQRSGSYDALGEIQPRQVQSRLHVEQLLKMVLQDAQTRLVARGQALIRSDVEYYTPKGDDLDYPGKIERAPSQLRSDKRILSISLDEEDQEDPAFFELPSKDTQETWYPTLRSTLWVLSCLHTYVETDVFEDLAHEAIAGCRHSLISASKTLSTKSQLDGQLFLVRHLLILKEMTASVDLVRRYRAETPSRGVVETLSALLANALRMVGVGALLGLGKFSSSAGSNVDAKADVDRELKSVCEDMITACANQATAPIRSFVDQSTAYLATAEGAAKIGQLAKLPWATGEKVLEMHTKLREQLESACDSWIKALKLYLQDEATVRVLIPPLQNDVMDHYRPFFDLIRSEYPEQISGQIMSPQGLLALLQKIESAHLG